MSGVGSWTTCLGPMPMLHTSAPLISNAFAFIGVTHVLLQHFSTVNSGPRLKKKVGALLGMSQKSGCFGDFLQMMRPGFPHGTGIVRTTLCSFACAEKNAERRGWEG